MRDRVFGTIGILWGGAIVVFMVLRGGPQGRGAYGGGELAGLVVGALMLIAGLYTFFKKRPPN
jgi:hypothetical protein